MRTKEKKLTKKEKIRNFRIKTLLVFIALVFAIVLIISAISGRSSKATIKQFINSINKSNQEKFISLIDPEGCQALSECYAITNQELSTILANSMLPIMKKIRI